MIGINIKDTVTLAGDPPDRHAEQKKHVLVIDPLPGAEKRDLEAYHGSWKVKLMPKASGGTFPDRTNLVIEAEDQSAPEKKLFVKLAYSDGGGGEEFSRVRRHIDEEVENLRHITKLEDNNTDDSDISHKVGHVAQIIAQATLYVKTKEGYSRFPALIEKHVEGVSLEDWMKKWWEGDTITNEDTPRKLLQLWTIFAFACSNIVRRIHNRGVIHGWIQPRHIILSENWKSLSLEMLPEIRSDHELISKLLTGVHLVGFGTSAIVFDPDKGDDAKRLMEDEVFAAPELRNSGTIDGIFSYPVDLFSLGAILLYTAVGLIYPLKFEKDVNSPTEHPKPKGKPKETESAPDEKKPTRNLDEIEDIHLKIKDTIRAAGGGTVDEVKKNVANALKDRGWPTEALARVIDKAMRKEREDRYLCAEEMMQFILNLLDDLQKEALLKHILPSEYTKKVTETLASVLDPNRKHTNQPSDFLGRFFSSRVGEVCAWQGLSAFSKSPHFEVYGSRDLLLDWLCSFMSYLRPGDEYCTRTILPYWTDANLGSTGRFLVKNKDLVMDGVTVKRIFIVAHDFAELPIDEQMALVGQREMQSELSNTKIRNGFKVRVRRAENLNKLMQVERRNQLVAFVKRKISEEGEKPEKFDYFGFSFMSRGQRYQEFDESYLRASITKLRFRHLDMSDKDDQLAVEEFNATWNGDSVPLDEYLNYGVSLEQLLAKTGK